jgi:hypothetical protein
MHDRCIRRDDEIDERDDGGGVVEILDGIAEMAQLRTCVECCANGARRVRPIERARSF